MPPSLRLVIAGGGTGGHVQPALAVLQSLTRQVDVNPLWIGSRDGIEQSVANENDVPFRAIQTGKLRRYFSLQTPVDAMRIPLGMAQSFRILRQFRPDVIFSTGGFVSVPTVLAGRLLGIASVTHEQTATVGLATKINAKFADVVALSFERSRSALAGTKARVIVTGNPIRESLFGGSVDAGRDHFSLPHELPMIYVTGGVLGAQAINSAVQAALPKLLQRAVILHQCGPASRNADLPRLESARNDLPVELQCRYAVRERIGAELGDVYAAASLVVGRAGAGTVAELAALGKPSLLIPLPGTGGDEQTLNAHVLADAGASVLLPQDQLTPDRLVKEVEELISSPKLDEMSSAARSLGRTDAAGRLASAILDLARE
ncbi:MAG: undecaprenyldiphospho-muramoylpentapeptide beta-N-acetylglucosaminyltransferase [Nitrolancea sp.]